MSTQPLANPHATGRHEHPANQVERTSSDRNPVAAAAIRGDQSAKSQFGIFLILLFAFVAGILMASNASGQAAFPYDSVEMPQALNDDAVVRRVEGIAKSFASTGKGDQAMVNGYFKVYIPAKMTAPDGVKEISTVAAEVSALLVRAQRSSNQQVAQQISLYLLQSMKGLAEGNYHPAARINAILLLTRLDRQPANPSTKTPPVPLQQTLPILLGLYQDNNNVDGVRAAALHGILRHVRLGFPQIDQATRATITQAMTSLLTSPAPAGRNAKAHAYLQRFAVDILDILREPADNSLGVQLVSISSDSTRPDLIALYSAARSGAYGPTMQGEVTEPRKVLNSWGRRVLNAFESEIQRYDQMEKVKPDTSQPVNPESFLETKKQESSRSRGTGGDMGMGMGGQMDDQAGMMDGMDGSGMGMGMGGDMDMDMDMGMGMGGYGSGTGPTVEANPQPAEVIATRKKLNYVLQQVQLGMTGYPVAGMPTKTPGGLLASVVPDQKLTVEEWVLTLEGVITVLNDRSLDDLEKFREGIEEQIVVLQDLVGAEISDPAANQVPDELTPVDPLAGATTPATNGNAASAPPVNNAGANPAVNAPGNAPGNAPANADANPPANNPVANGPGNNAGVNPAVNAGGGGVPAGSLGEN